MRRLLALFAFTGLVAFQVLPVYAVDGDGDMVQDEVDVCPEVADPFQGDLDGDGLGDRCESDSDGATSFDGTPAADLVFGTDGDDSLSGAGGDDALYGEAGDDTLDGGDGLDFLAGGPGVDTLTGGASCDVFAFDPAGDEDVIADFDPETDRLLFPPHDEDPSDDPTPVATFGGDDHLVVTFGAEGGTTATLGLEGLPADVEISLNSQPCDTAPDEIPFLCAPLFDFGIDELDIFAVPLPFDGVELFGTSANETLTGTDCSDIIVGDVEIFLGDSEPSEAFDEPPCDPICSNDVIYGLAGNDLLIGDKTVLAENETGGNDTIYGGDGDDIVVGDAVILVPCLCGGVGEFGTGLVDGPIGGNDTLYGEDGDDVMLGDSLEAIVGGYGGNDYMDGGDGDDIIIGDTGFFIGELGVGGDDTLIGGAGDDVIVGDTFGEIEEDSAGGDDILIGGAGDDVLYGDADVVNGAAGQDTFVYDTNSNFGDDTIVDLGALEIVDTIQFSGTELDFTELELRTLWADVASDLLATVYTDSGHGTAVGSILIDGPGGFGIASWTDLMAGWPVNVVVV